MIYLFEIYDSRLKTWYVDYITKDINNAQCYLDYLLKFIPRKSIKIITKLC